MTAFGYLVMNLVHMGSPAPLPPPDRRDPTPLYFWLSNMLRARIESLEHPSGTRLPTERGLAEVYRVSRVTVRQALDMLAREGLIRRDRGRSGGTFVRDAPARTPTDKLSGSFDTLFSKRHVSRIDVLAFDVRPSNAAISAVLRVPAGTPVRYVERILVTPVGAVAHVRNFLPLTRARRLTRSDLETMMLQEALRKHGTRLVRVEDEVEAALADTHEAGLLDLRPGRPLLSLRRVFFAARNEPVNLTLLLIASDRYKMTVTLRKAAARRRPAAEAREEPHATGIHRPGQHRRSDVPPPGERGAPRRGLRRAPGSRRGDDRERGDRSR